MATILESLKSVSAYPVPLRTLVETGERRGLSLTDEATQAVLLSKNYKLAVADLFLWLSLAPNVSQGGQSYSFSEDERHRLRNRANSLYDELGEEDTSSDEPTYGYKGSQL